MTSDLNNFREKWLLEINEKSEQKQSDTEDEIKPIDKSNSLDNSLSKARKDSSNFQPFIIADGLLMGKNASDSIGDSKYIETSSYSPKPKRLKLLEEAETFIQDKNSDSFLDQFIADINEINEIPFFDCSLSREIGIKIFKFLDVKSLCYCCQVSKAWKSLAEDKIIWCHLFKKLDIKRTFESKIAEVNWKLLVQNYINEERKLQENWRNRIGEYRKFQHIQGGVLCAVDSHNQHLIAGYMNGGIKYWNISSGEECLFNESDIGLLIDERETEGCIQDHTSVVAVNDRFVAACSTQGSLDIWSLKHSVKPIQNSLVHQHNVKRGLLFTDQDTLFSWAGSTMRVFSFQQEDELFSISEPVDFEQQIKDICLIPNDSDDILIWFSDRNTIDLFNAQLHNTSIVTEAFQLWISCLDANSTHLVYGCGDGFMADAFRFNIKLFDISHQKELCCFYGNTCTVSCINLRSSPSNLFVSGASNQRVLVYDTRIQSPVISFPAAGSRCTMVQMDETKVICGSEDGYVRVWDQRTTSKLWEFHNRHPVRHLKFTEETLLTANIPVNLYPELDYDNSPQFKDRGSLQLYDFTVNQSTDGVPDICSSSYDIDTGYNYNIRLAMPYDKIK